MEKALQQAYGLLIVAGWTATVCVSLYLLSWFLVWLLRFVPLIGRRHRHQRWDELNGIDSRRKGPFRRRPRLPHHQSSEGR